MKCALRSGADPDARASQTRTAHFEKENKERRKIEKNTQTNSCVPSCRQYATNSILRCARWNGRFNGIYCTAVTLTSDAARRAEARENAAERLECSPTQTEQNANEMRL